MFANALRAAAAGLALTAAAFGSVSVDASQPIIDHFADDVRAEPDPRGPSSRHADQLLTKGGAQSAGGSGDEGSCLEFDGVNTLYDEHEVSLIHYNSNGVPSGKVFDLVFELCRRNVDGPVNAGQLVVARDAVDAFIAVLQEHFETRDPQTWESPLTDCFEANGTTYTIPWDLADGVDLPSYQPIIGYQLAFDQDPRITMFISNLPDAGGSAFLKEFPVDANPDPYRNIFSLSEQHLSPWHVDYLAGTIAHELAHRIGYTHKPVHDDDKSPLIVAMGHCFEDAFAASPAPPKLTFEIPDSGHGGEAPDKIAR
ncbi:MAG: hypothetical protein AAFY28_07755 [Actinomycetota bacterium]